MKTFKPNREELINIFEQIDKLPEQSGLYICGNNCKYKTGIVNGIKYTLQTEGGYLYQHDRTGVMHMIAAITRKDYIVV